MLLYTCTKSLFWPALETGIEVGIGQAILEGNSEVIMKALGEDGRALAS